MSEENHTKLVKTRRSAVRDIKRMKIVAEVMGGKTITQIAKEMGMCRSQVSSIFNSKSDETKKLLDTCETIMKSMALQSIDALSKVLELKDSPNAEDQVNSLKAAIPILKSIGIVKDKTEVSMSFLKPHVIERMDGTRIELGVGEREVEEVDDSEDS